ncbi:MULTISPECIES: hydroxyacid dehydrogenase [unclassified Herbaspirillum]|uniref:hydroxyacid dehydrogenase n=1 Tax=unclassified Herbaspirillum TaxID=2624150 RepID=UPI0011526A2E|nr:MULTISPECIES: hydroxyacid dehydrogenase [unclassified Herbaspirillum]MBB5391193.1 D-3-phosphoglycerate dehydrogenase [Herbaspirillum sp. SJZ102]TQK13116.1 D-3-phosphoglycerate dehydrogenase [Herbaspirillum sp. SJZ130]TQK15120.1 D-3-phosphoglycerate dehydrogenase [Herbaspirillum sp. SJZ106]
MSAAGKKGVVLVTGADLAPQAIDILRDYELVFAGAKPTEDDLLTLSAQHQPVAIIVRYGGVTGRIMDASKALRVISKHGTGIDTIDSKAAQERGIAVKAAVGANAPAVAEHTWALIFACAKNVTGLDRRMRQGHWDKSTHKSVELQGRTLGLVGLGAIGRRVALTALSLGMRVIAHDPFASQAPAGVELADLETVFAQSDVLSLHCPLTDENKRMVNAQSLARMKDGAILVNTARGGLIDEAALVEALNSGKLRAAGLDSFAQEPFTAPHPLQDIGNVVLSPHIGGVSDRAYIAMGTSAASNVLAVVEAEQALA